MAKEENKTRHRINKHKCISKDPFVPLLFKEMPGELQMMCIGLSASVARVLICWPPNRRLFTSVFVSGNKGSQRRKFKSVAGAAQQFAGLRHHSYYS